MTDDRYKKIMTDLGMPNSNSLLLALKQVANETAQEIFKTRHWNPLRFTCYRQPVSVRRMEEIPVSGLEGIYQTCKVLAEHTGETELVPMIKSILAENEALHTKLARFKKWNSQLTAKCNWYNCDGARLEREIEALKAELKAINTALDDPRTDLTMTACEVIVALKEQIVH